MKIDNQWCVVIIDDEDEHPNIPAIYGPFNKKDAREFARSFNEEHDGSPFWANIWQITKVVVDG